MPPPEVWGPPIWTLFHVLAEKIKEEEYTKVIQPLFHHIKKICIYLPCPECSKHATAYLSRVQIQNYKTKEDFKKFVFDFHNKVNMKKKKELFKEEDLEKYKNTNIVDVINGFIHIYNNKGNMNMIAESFQRQIVLNDFKRWILTSGHHSFYK